MPMTASHRRRRATQTNRRRARRLVVETPSSNARAAERTIAASSACRFSSRATRAATSLGRIRGPRGTRAGRIRRCRQARCGHGGRGARCGRPVCMRLRPRLPAWRVDAHSGRTASGLSSLPPSQWAGGRVVTRARVHGHHSRSRAIETCPVRFRPRDRFVRRKAREAATAIVFGLGLAVLGVLVVVTGPLATRLGEWIGAGDAAVTAWSIGKWPTALALAVGMVAGCFGWRWLRHPRPDGQSSPAPASPSPPGPSLRSASASTSGASARTTRPMVRSAASSSS